jgi:hypothetical protein
MAGCGCGSDERSVAEKIAALVVCTKTHQCFVTHITEKALPILFWLGIIGSFVGAFKVANTLSEFSRAFYIGNLDIILAFITVLIGSIVVVFLTFYTIYLLKSIKDKLKSDESSSCGCGGSGHESKAEEVVEEKAAISATITEETSSTVEPVAPVESIKKRPGRKPAAPVVEETGFSAFIKKSLGIKQATVKATEKKVTPSVDVNTTIVPIKKRPGRKPASAVEASSVAAPAKKRPGPKPAATKSAQKKAAPVVEASNTAAPAKKRPGRKPANRAAK